MSTYQLISFFIYQIREVDWNSSASISIQAHSTKSVSLALRKEECQTIQRYEYDFTIMNLESRHVFGKTRENTTCPIDIHNLLSAQQGVSIIQ